ncbi:MAG: hypothetical protein L3K25_18990 [Gammaproteobacteria bacterium]|nr:hypothetical protein [Gammaproteobacteria bacterium]
MKKISETIFINEYSAKIMPGVHFPVNTSFIELEKNELAVISPGPFEQEMIREIITKYSTVYCVSPNILHHKHLKNFNNIFPGINIYGPSALTKKQPWLSEKILSLNLLAEKLKGQISFFPILGNPFLDETVFYCHQSKSLIITDLFFNMRDPMPLGRKCILSLVGARNKISQSKLVKNSIKNKEAYAQSVKPLGKLDCLRIIVGHGHIIEEIAEIKKSMKVIGAIENK